MGKAMQTVIKPVDEPLFCGRVTITIQPMCGPKQRRYDTSNYSMAYKMIEDWLVTFGWLRNDSIGDVGPMCINPAVRVKTREEQGHQVSIRGGK